MERLMTLREAAEVSGVGYSTLRDAVTANRLEHVRVGATGKRGVRVTESGLERFIASRTRPGTEPRSASSRPQPEEVLVCGPVLPVQFANLRSVRRA